MKLKEKKISPETPKNVVAEAFYLYTEHSYPPKKQHSLLPLWIFVAILWLGTIFLSFPRAQNYLMGKLLPPAVHYGILEQRTLNELQQNRPDFPEEYIFTLSGTAYDRLLEDFPETAYKIKNPFSDGISLPEAPDEAVSRSFDGKNTVFSLSFPENSMKITVDPDGKIICREFALNAGTALWQDLSAGNSLDAAFTYENGEDNFSLTVTGAKSGNAYTGIGEIQSSYGKAGFFFENFSFGEVLTGNIKLTAQSGASAELSLSGTPGKPAAEVNFLNGGEKLISYKINPAEAENPEELTAFQIFNLFSDLTAVEEFSPENASGVPEHPCVRSIDLSGSKIKIGRRYIGLPALLENLPDLFKLEGETVQPGQKRLFATENREVVIVLKNYNEKTEDAMKCDVVQMIVKGSAGNKLWELKLNGVGIGSTEHQTVSVLGAPSYTENYGKMEVYCYHDCENDIEFKFGFDNGVISQIVFAV